MIVLPNPLNECATCGLDFASLAAFGEDAVTAIPALVQVMQDQPAVSRKAAAALGNMGSKAVPSLIKLSSLS